MATVKVAEEEERNQEQAATRSSLLLPLIEKLKIVHTGRGSWCQYFAAVLFHLIIMATLKLPTRDTFPAFPYATPYSIQLDLMRHLHSSIEESKVTVIESPTGTVS